MLDKMNSVILIIFLFFGVSVNRICALYNADLDVGIYVLSSENVNATVYRRLEPNRHVTTEGNVWIIQFYNSWCGHCIKFSPVFKALGNKTQFWSAHLKLGTVDCADDLNRALCTRFRVRQTPVLRVLQPFSNMSNVGEDVEIQRSSVDLLQGILDVMEFNRVPEELSPLDVRPISQIWTSLLPPGTVNELAVIVEPIGSYIGKESVMHLLPNLHAIAVRRTYSNNRALLESLSVSEEAPFIIFLERKNPLQRGIVALDSLSRQLDPVEAFSEAILRADVELTSRLRIARRPRLGPVYDVHRSHAVNQRLHYQQTPAVLGPVAASVSLQDLNSAIVYALSNEVGRRDEITGREYEALKAFVGAALKWVPVKAATRAALTNIDAALGRRTLTTGAEILRILRESRLKFDGDTIEWDNCRGSVPDRRGYPCGLWQVFHTMSIRAYEESLTTGRGALNTLGPDGVLTAIIGYVEHFFTCGECSRNFMRGTESLRRNSLIVSPADAVLFLWRAHNNANRFLAGDFSEDPAYPKRQFPTLMQCMDCRKTTDPQATIIVWNETNILRFLKEFYGVKSSTDRGQATFSMAKIRRRRKSGLDA